MKHELGQYMTPAWAARELWEAHFGELGFADTVLEPTCGTGCMLDAVPDYINTVAYEIDPELAQVARERTGRQVFDGDVLEADLPEFTAVFGNPPFRSAFMDRFLDKIACLADEGLRCGLILPAYFMQTPSQVIRWNRNWSIATEMLPRILFPNLSKPLIFATFTRDSAPSLTGMRLYYEAEALRDLKPVHREELVSGKGLWFPVIAAALRKLGGSAHITMIYAEVAKKRPSANKWWREKIRQTLQRKFYSVGSGEWSLTAQAA